MYEHQHLLKPILCVGSSRAHMGLQLVNAVIQSIMISRDIAAEIVAPMASDQSP